MSIETFFRYMWGFDIFSSFSLIGCLTENVVSNTHAQKISNEGKIVNKGESFYKMWTKFTKQIYVGKRQKMS